MDNPLQSINLTDCELINPINFTIDIYLRFKNKNHAESLAWDLEPQIHRRLAISNYSHSIRKKYLWLE